MAGYIALLSLAITPPGVCVIRLPPPSYSSLTSPDLGMSSSPSHSAHGAPPPPNNSGNGDDQAGVLAPCTTVSKVSK